jgi:hypothetical protein
MCRLSGWCKKTLVFLNALALLYAKPNVLGTAHPIVEILWLTVNADKLIDVAIKMLLVEQGKCLVAKSHAAGNKAEGLVELCDAQISTSFGQPVQLLLGVLLGRYSDKELPKVLFELVEVLGAVRKILLVGIIVIAHTRLSAVKAVLRVVLRLLLCFKAIDELVLKLGGVVSKV